MLSCLMMFRLLLALEAAEVPGCNPDFVDGQSAVPRDCVWSEQKVPAKHVVINSPRSLGALPIVILSPLDSVEPAPVGGGCERCRSEYLGSKPGMHPRLYGNVLCSCNTPDAAEGSVLPR